MPSLRPYPRIHLCVKINSLNTRIYIKKHDNFDIKSAALQKELKSVGFDGFISTYSLYDLFNVKESEIALITSSIISDSVSGNSISEIPKHENIFAIEYLPGQFDIRADATMQCCQLLFGHNDIIVQTATVYGLDHFNESDIPFIKKYLINAIDSREKDLSVLKLHQSKKSSDIQIIEGFINYNNEGLKDFLKEKRLSIDINDLICIQHYFREEKRNPTITEIKAIDTYWSDHCRHTTFLTELTDIVFSGDFSKEMESTFERYLKIRTELGRIDKKITLMDLGTILPKYFSSKNLLPEYYHSKENNAATITIDADVKGENEKWLLLFKNETHNHPTEIEPFGGAATCIGGAIRDPLSGRAFVYQAMRISGAGNPLENINNTIPSKLPQQKISKESALGYSSYGNQIGLSTTLVTEIYDEGYKAKRLECGFVIGAVKKTSVKEIDPVDGDVVLLIGGDTGRDGIGGASGSSLQHNESSISTMQSEVQKGNAITERKIQKLFRNQEVVQLIKKCNDFGAGGVCVAIGEIAESVEINLNNVPLKYEGLDGTEIALSESQERMAVVVSKKDAETFIKYAEIENLKATQVATVTNEGALKMKWNGKEILHLKRSFLDTNGAAKKINVIANVDRWKIHAN